VELEKAAPAALPKGKGRLKQLVISREICNWQRFNNRRQVSSYTDFARGNIARGANGWPVPSQSMGIALLVEKSMDFDSRPVKLALAHGIGAQRSGAAISFPDSTAERTC
jgi:hypothetical protein